MSIAWLAEIRRRFRGRPLLIADYYGRLGNDDVGTDQDLLLHDYAQLISGQGVPPHDVSEWKAIYAEAGCRLVHVTEDISSSRFIHIVLL